MNILIAPNAFKHSLPADKAARAIREGLSQSNLKGSYECFPIGDGGDGTGQLIIQKLHGRTIAASVQDPLGRKIQASFGMIKEGATAVIEMAAASGLHLLPAHELDPLKATSYGTGELIRQALDRKAAKVIITMGGSATVDGGMGMLRALGVHFLNEKGKELHTPEELISLYSIDLSGMDQRLRTCEIVVLCDVDNRLLGKEGAARVFGPQKGASPADVEVLDAALGRLSEVILKETGRDIASFPYGGTAGGAAAGMAGLAGATLAGGADYFLDLTGFDSSLEKYDLVITGEGSIDEQTLNGKGPFGVACRAKKRGLPVIGIAGKVPLKEADGLRSYFDVLTSIGNEPLGLADSFGRTKDNLIRTGREIGNLLALGT